MKWRMSRAAQLVAVLMLIAISAYLALPSRWPARGDGLPAQPQHPWLRPGDADPGREDPCGEDIAGETDESESEPVDAASVAVARKSCRHGDVVVTVRVNPAFGYRYGDIVTAEVLIEAASTYTFDFSTLKRGFVRFDAASAFELADAESVTVSQSNPGGERMRYRLTIRLRSFVETGKQVPLVIDVFFSDGKMRSRLSTPEVLISYARTVDTAKELIDTSVGEVAVPVPWLSIIFYLLALVLGLPLPAVLMHKWMTGKRKLTAEESFWQTVEPVLRRAGKGGFGAAEAETVFRELGVLWKCQAATPQEVLALHGNENGADDKALSAVIESCQQILYQSGERLSGAQLQEFISALTKVVPRPWTRKGGILP